MTCRMVLVGLFVIAGGLHADPVDPPELGLRGTWTETRADMPDTILVHRNGHVMEVNRVPGTGTNGIPLQLVGPSEVSMKWVNSPTNWPPEITVLAEEPMQ